MVGGNLKKKKQQKIEGRQKDKQRNGRKKQADKERGGSRNQTNKQSNKPGARQVGKQGEQASKQSVTKIWLVTLQAQAESRDASLECKNLEIHYVFYFAF